MRNDNALNYKKNNLLVSDVLRQCPVCLYKNILTC